MKQWKRPTADGRQVSFVKYTELGEWKTWRDGRISVRIPIDWNVQLDEKNKDGDIGILDATTLTKWSYRVTEPNGPKPVFHITVHQGGPAFIECFCASKRVYENTNKDGLRIWALSISGIHARTFKAATKTMRIDVHCELPETNPEHIRYIVESVRPIEPGNKKAK